MCREMRCHWELRWGPFPMKDRLHRLQSGYCQDEEPPRDRSQTELSDMTMPNDGSQSVHFPSDKGIDIHWSPRERATVYGRAEKVNEADPGRGSLERLVDLETARGLIL